MAKKYPNPPKLYELSNSVSEKLFHTNPFRLLTSQRYRDYADTIVKDCGVRESVVGKILADSYDADSLFLDILGDDNEVSEQGEAVVRAYTKAIEVLEKATRHKVIADDKSYSGTAFRRAHISLRDAIQDDIEDLKKKRERWAGLFIVHPELKAEPISKTATGMFTNQAYNVFLYIQKCQAKAGYKEDASIHELISELFMAIYDHPFFHASEKFTPKKIKEYCDNGKRKRRLKKTKLRKYIESL
jgi:hypothetical protein